MVVEPWAHNQVSIHDNACLSTYVQLDLNVLYENYIHCLKHNKTSFNN